MNTISGSAKLIEGSGRANILLPGGTKINIDDALYSTKSQRSSVGFSRNILKVYWRIWKLI